jgi:hypothetical protein
VKALLLSDIHLSDRSPSSCTESYMEDLLKLLGETVAVAEEHKVDAVVWAGDVFNSKAPARNSHWLVQQVTGVLLAYQRPCFIVPGNHDVQHDDLSSIWKTQPLGVLYRTGVAKPLIGRCREFPQLFGVPWQQEWSNENVGEALRGFREGDADLLSPPPRARSLVVAHAPLYPPGMELSFEYYDTVMWSAAMGHRGSCFYGHVHEYHGSYDVAGVKFCNNGALSRGSLHEHNLTRQVMCTIWDSTDVSFTEVPLHAKPASEVFRLREKQEVVDSALKLDEFLSGVGSTQFDVLSVESVLAHVRGLGVGKDVEDEVAELLDWSAHQT